MVEEDDFHKQVTHPGIPTSKDSSAFKIPEKIGPFKIESLLEKGGMSLVYMGVHPETQEPITIKVLSQRFLTNQDIVKRFVNEAEIIAMADHPHIVKLYGHGEWEGGLYIAMEFIQGISLKQLIQHTPLSLRRSIEIIIDVAYALCHLHTHGVIHRDLKPENILITENDEIKVIDFGIAQLLREDGEEGAEGRRFIGTPFYMSPEQKNNPESVSYPSDIYSLGIIAYELVLGKLSHGHVHLSLMPKGLQKILAKALQPRVEDRYLDIVDFISDLSAYMNSEELDKEKKAGDQFSEMSDQLSRVQSILAPKPIPKWPKMEIGLSHSKGVGVLGCYYDFFNLSHQNYGFFVAEPASKGMLGVMHASGLRSMVRSLIKIEEDPEKLMSLLNEEIALDIASGQVFVASDLQLSPDTNQFHYISCGYTDLWHIPAGIDYPERIIAENIALGVDMHVEFTKATHAWSEGDTLILCSAAIDPAGEKSFTEQQMKELISEYVHMPPQKQSEGILRKIKTFYPKLGEDRPITVLAILRN